MALDNLTPAENSTHKAKRVGRGQGSGMGKTASRGNNGQKSRTGYKRKEVLKVVNNHFKEDFQKLALVQE